MWHDDATNSKAGGHESMKKKLTIDTVYYIIVQTYYSNYLTLYLHCIVLIHRFFCRFSDSIYFTLNDNHSFFCAREILSSFLLQVLTIARGNTCRIVGFLILYDLDLKIYIQK